MGLSEALAAGRTYSGRAWVNDTTAPKEEQWLSSCTHLRTDAAEQMGPRQDDTSFCKLGIYRVFPPSPKCVFFIQANVYQ